MKRGIGRLAMFNSPPIKGFRPRIYSGREICRLGLPSLHQGAEFYRARNAIITCSPRFVRPARNCVIADTTAATRLTAMRATGKNTSTTARSASTCSSIREVERVK